MEVGLWEVESGDGVRVKRLCCNNEAECARCSSICERMEVESGERGESCERGRGGGESKGRARRFVCRQAKRQAVQREHATARARVLHLTSPIVAAPATLNGVRHLTPY